MPVLVTGIHTLNPLEDVDGKDKPCHDVFFFKSFFPSANAHNRQVHAVCFTNSYGAPWRGLTKNYATLSRFCSSVDDVVY
jgi:hypothetical protein